MRAVIFLSIFFFSNSALASGPIEWGQKDSELKQLRLQSEALERIAIALEKIAENH